MIKEVLKVDVNNTKLDKNAVFKNQDIPIDIELPQKVNKLYSDAVKIFIEFSNPFAIISDISIPKFEEVYFGIGLNEKETPLEQIVKKADYLALFAVTIGNDISEKIEELFNSNDFALGSMLDAVASEGTECVTDVIQNHFKDSIIEREYDISTKGILRYSPGYCGWHISGQKKIFEYLHPEDIGIKLLDSYLMKPLKSISGVIVVGDREIHIFKVNFPFCSQCNNHFCRDRIRMLFKNKGNKE
jgi:hypothetical protein